MDDTRPWWWTDFSGGFREPWTPQVGQEVIVRLRPESELDADTIAQCDGKRATVKFIGAKPPFRFQVDGEVEGWVAAHEIEPAPPAASERQGEGSS